MHVLPQAAQEDMTHSIRMESLHMASSPIHMPSNSEHSSSGPAHSNSRENATAPSQLPSVSLEDEKDEEIAHWKHAYHDTLAEKTNKKDTEKKNP